jgi:CRP/FNR family transcriptional regulator, cyclic AMP receptor protein
VDFAEVWRMADALQDVVPIFTLSEDERREIVSHMRVRRFDANEVIYHQGDPGQDLLVVYSGRVASVLEGADGDELLLGVYGRGQFLGELELFKSSPGRLTTVRAMEPTTALQIAHADAVRVLRGNAEAMYFMSRRVFELYDRLRHTTAGLAFGDAHSRVADALLALNAVGDPDPVPLTQAKVATAAGVGERMFRKVVAEFAKSGLIDVLGPGRIRVLDQTRLEAEIQAILPEESRAEFRRRLGDVFVRDA